MSGKDISDNNKGIIFRKKAIRQNAEELFASYFVREMKNKNITLFKKDYKTLYNNVIIPMTEFLIEKQIKPQQNKDINNDLNQ